jgi:acetoin utilization deacetylase AcuC-like enzyme
MPVVWSDDHRLHDPGGETWLGLEIPPDEVPARADRIRAALTESGASLVDARRQPDDALTAVHDEQLVRHLERAWADWRDAGLDMDPGQDRVVPYLFPHPDLFSGELAARAAASITARAGQFGYDTLTAVGPGTWEAARGAVDAAVTAAELVAEGAPAAYACTRPPGHHATRGSFGGSCYLNNSASAAARLRAAGHDRVAVIDVDAHHGNGTQAIFWDDPAVLTGSVHVDPAEGWFPHYVGFEDERGADDSNRNILVAPGAGDDPWTEAVAELVEWARAGGATTVVVPLGVDAAGDDPEAPLNVSAAGFRAAGRALGALGLPTVAVQEGGYVLDTLGGLVLEVLTGIEEGMDG